MAVRRAAFSAALALAVAACSSEPRQPADPVSVIRAAIAKRRAGPPAPFVAPTAASVARMTTPGLYVSIPKREAKAVLVPLAQNGAVTTWTTGDATTLGVRDGVIVATRGLGPDLMSAGAPAARTLGAGTGRTERLYVTLDGDDQPIRQTFVCGLSATARETIAVAERPYLVQRVTERCENGPTNVWWIDPAGRIRQSHQWLGARIGYADVQALDR